MRKRIGSFFLVISMLFAVCACEDNENKDDTENETVSKNDESTTLETRYNLSDVSAFTVEEDSVWVIKNESSLVEKYDDNGDLVDEIEVGDGEYFILDNCEEKMYIYSTDEKPYIIEVDTQEETVEKHEVQGAFSSPFYMTAMKDDIYAICWDPDENETDVDEKDEASYEKDGYISMGEYAVKINTTTYETTVLNLENVIGQCRYSDTQLLYYAHDDEGYYFMIYDCEADTYSEKYYNNAFGYQFCLAADLENNYIFAADNENSRLIVGELEDSEKRKDILDNVSILGGNDLYFSNGYCFMLDNLTGDIVRLDCSEVESKMVLTVYADNAEEAPYSCGYDMNIETPDETQFETSILACDKTYDMAYVTSGATYARGINKQGAYYPLQNVANVNEYLDACYPYVKDAATSETGDVWMIPVGVQIPFIVYSETNCDAAGIDDDFYTSYEGIISAADTAYKNENNRELYSVNAYQLQAYMIEQYCGAYVSNDDVQFDTDEFKTICDTMKDNSPDTKVSLHTFVSNAYSNDIIFEMTHYNEYKDYSQSFVETSNVVNMPYITDSNGDTVEKNFGSCLFLCVNPNSQNLDETLEYISAYCGYMLENDDNLLLKENENKISDIYENGEISFGIPEDVFWDSYLDYIRGNMKYKDMVKDVENKVKTYLNE